MPTSTLTPRQALENQRFPLASMLYHESVGIVFAAIPKVGCSALKRWHIAMTDPEKAAEPGLDVHKHVLLGLTLSSRGRDEAMAILDGAPLVAFVRDPVERMRSAFVEKFVGPTAAEIFEPAREMIEDVHRLRGVNVVLDREQVVRFTSGWTVTVRASNAVDYDRGLTFREFVGYICGADENHLEEHWRPQAAFVRGRPVDAVLPLSAMNGVLESLARSLGREAVAVAVENKSAKRTAGSGSLADTPSSELHDRWFRPPVNELADDAIRALAHRSLREDYALLDRAMREVGENGEGAGGAAGMLRRLLAAR